MAQTKRQDLQLLFARILRLVNQDMRVLQRRGVGAQSLDRQPHHVLEIDLVQRMHAGVHRDSSTQVAGKAQAQGQKGSVNVRTVHACTPGCAGAAAPGNPRSSAGR